MNPFNPPPRNELPEPLQSLINEMASEPVPEDLIQSVRRFSVSVPAKAKPHRSGLALVVSVLALSLCVAALVVHEQPLKKPLQVTEEIQTMPARQTEEVPPPTLWAYRQAAHSDEALEELLNRHASMLLTPDRPEDLRPFQQFARKENL